MPTSAVVGDLEKLYLDAQANADTIKDELDEVRRQIRAKMARFEECAALLDEEPGLSKAVKAQQTIVDAAFDRYVEAVRLGTAAAKISREFCPLCGEDVSTPSPYGPHACNRVGASSPAPRRGRIQSATLPSGGLPLEAAASTPPESAVARLGLAAAAALPLGPGGEVTISSTEGGRRFKMPALKPDVITVFDTGLPSAGVGPGNTVGVYKLSSVGNRVRGTTFTSYENAMKFVADEVKRSGSPVDDRTLGGAPLAEVVAIGSATTGPKARSYRIVGVSGVKEFENFDFNEFVAQAEALGFKKIGSVPQPDHGDAPAFANLYGPFAEGKTGWVRYDTAQSHALQTDYTLPLAERSNEPEAFKEAVADKLSKQLPVDIFGARPTVDQIFDWHVIKDMPSDIKQGSSYEPSPGVMENREYGRQKAQLELLGKSVRKDFWVEGGIVRVSCGFRDNMSLDAYGARRASSIRMSRVEAMQTLRNVIAPFGFKLRVAPSGIGTVTLNKELAEGFAAKHERWVEQLRRERAEKSGEVATPAVGDAGARPSEWKVNWKTADDRGSFPERFPSRSAAEAFGANWVIEMSVADETAVEDSPYEFEAVEAIDVPLPDEAVRLAVPEVVPRRVDPTIERFDELRAESDALHASDTQEKLQSIKNGLKSRSRKAWSVMRDGQWFRITAPPARRVNGSMSVSDTEELARLLSIPLVEAQGGVSLKLGGGFLEEYVDRAWGREPARRGVDTWND